MNRDNYIINEFLYKKLLVFYEKIKDKINLSGNLIDSFDPLEDKHIYSINIDELNDQSWENVENDLISEFKEYYGKDLQFKVPVTMTDTGFLKVRCSCILYIEKMIVRIYQLNQSCNGKQFDGFCIDFIFKINQKG